MSSPFHKIIKRFLFILKKFINDDFKKLKSLKHSDIDTDSYNNRYVMLLQRLDEEEGLCEPSIEEKLKLAEDRLRLSCAKFCEEAETLLGNKDTEPTLMNPQAVQEIFKAECFEASFRPPKSELKALQKDRKRISSLKSMSLEQKKDDRAQKKLKQAYYLPPSSWFASEKSSDDLSSEEIELLSSCATKAFTRYLEEKGKEISKIFSVHPPDMTKTT